jgi:DNA-directed RNA polymerase subunit N (RpoN/RPB10)
MKTSSGSAAASAFAALYLKEKVLVESSFNHLTAGALHTLDESLFREYNRIRTIDDGGRDDCHLILAKACIRRIAHRCLDKYARLQSSQELVEDALQFYTLPVELQKQLASKYDTLPPTTWYESLDQLKSLCTTEDASLDRGKLWRLILDHPMTAYVPVQCQSCGHVVPDQYPTQQQTDAEVGLQEIAPTGDELELRAGWFRGPRAAVIFLLTCTVCKSVSKWYRSGHPQIILNPNKWGRLCGDQEDLRLTLAEYLNIPVRLACPLDWDHVWSEYNESSTAASKWQVQDNSARNFCCRLDEGIGCWTRVWAIHSNPDWCQDVTREYLTIQQRGGRADNNIDDKTMERYDKIIKDARQDKSGDLTQANTVNGYVLYRANLSDSSITVELQRAARDYGTKEWWELNDE